LISYEKSNGLGTKIHIYNTELCQVEKCTEKLMDNFQKTITLCSRLRIEHGRRHWKGDGKRNLNIKIEN
jgi:hypothetical protein